MKHLRPKLHLILLFVLMTVSSVSNTLFAQIQPPPDWTFTTNVNEAKVGDVVEVKFHAVIMKDWYLYSNDFAVEGPIKISFNYTETKGFKALNPQPTAIHSKKKTDDIWGGEVSYFAGKADFIQKYKVTGNGGKIKGTMEYQTCTDLTGKCVTFETPFEFNIKIIGAIPEEIPSKIEIPEKISSKDADLTIENPDNIEPIIIDSLSNKTQTLAKNYSGYAAYQDTGNCNPITFAGSTKDESHENLWLFALIAFLSGLVALLTPCVFPMIPMTVTFFMKSAGNKAKGIRNGIIYGLSIIVIFTIIGSLFSLLFGVQGPNWFSTNAGVNIFFFLVFVIFAISFFGAFEITLPSKFVNKIDQKSDKGGLTGVFFMAFTLVLVSFSCTGPIVGSILVESSQGSFLRPIIGMIGFSLAFALPFTMFAIFPQWLNSLPKSGGWLNSVKVVLGFVELAFGLKFLSVADQTYHWHLLDREIYIALWIVIFFLMGLYLIGKIKFSHDSEMKFLSVPRLFLSIITFSFVMYLIPGMWGASLPGLAGYLPPTTSHSFNLPSMIKGEGKGSICEKPKHSDFLHLPHGLRGYFDYKQAVDCSRQLNKPIFIDFTGHGCVNCRKMEEKVWADPEVLRRLEEDYIVVALYVDDRTVLPESEWITSKFDGQVKNSIGKINGDLQICRFNNNAQPFYCLIGMDEELLTEPKGTDGFDYDVKKFIKFLDEGKVNFEKKNNSIKVQ